MAWIRGLYEFTQVPYEDLSCQNCHTGDCSSCHEEPGDRPLMDKCLTCHGRQMKERILLTDVHFDQNNQECTDCHTSREGHGDGTSYISLLEEGAMDARCEGCHPPVPSNYSDVLLYAFVKCVSGCDNTQTAQWDFLKNGVDRWQILFATPLTPTQMDKLLNNP